jgi:two-component system sensor histidine kinase RpfC
MDSLTNAVSSRFANPELQSALVRLAIWAFSAGYVGFGSAVDYYRVDSAYYLSVFGIYLLLFSVVLLSILLRPVWPGRCVVSLIMDVSAISFAIFLTEEAISPFYLLYIWMFISYGTRYGAAHLGLASLMSVLAYNLVLLLLNEWQRHTFEAAFFLLLLMLLPLYQFTLLRQLHEARQAAERANQAKSDFLSTMTHELRTPLSSLIGMSRLLEGTKLEPEQQEYLHSIVTSGQLLRALIGDVLDLSKIEANKLQLEAVPFDLRQAVLEVSQACAAGALDKGLELICRVEPDFPGQVIGDPLRVRQILFNLVGNAVKFTECGEVVVSAAWRDGVPELPARHVCLTVRDSGIGISREKLAQVFREFWQADVSTTRHFGGTGLGTTIAANLSRLMGGWIGVTSELGQGAVFRVRLPLPLAAEAPLNVDVAGLRGRTILLYERHSGNRAWLGSLCRAFGMHVRYAENLADWDQPGWLDGLDLALLADAPAGEDLSAMAARLVGVPLLLLTYNSRYRTLPGLDVAVLSKPFLPGQLQQAILSRLGVGMASKAVAPPPWEKSGVALSVLVAEDNFIASKVISAFLDKLGHRVTLTKDGAETLACTAAQAFDIAFVDLRMPKLDGMAFTRAHRSLEKGSRLPIIALSANTAEDAGQAALAAGMDGFLTKPVDPEQLHAVIRRFCPSAA